MGSADRFPIATQRVRIFLYILFFLVTALGFLLVRNNSSIGAHQVSLILIWLTVVMAGVVGVMALIRFYARRENIFLFISTAFLGATVINLYQALIIGNVFGLVFTGKQASLSLATWYASAAYIFIFLALGLAIGSRESRGKLKKTHPLITYGIGILILLGILLFITTLPLQQPYFDDSLFGRPHELVLALLYLVLLSGFLYRGVWRRSLFEYWLIFFFIASFMGHAIFMSFSNSINDVPYLLAIIMRLVSDIFVVIGLLVSSFELFQTAVRRQRVYASQNIDLVRQRQKSDRTMEVLQTKDWELNKKVRELRVTKRAMMNVLEDFEGEKKKLQREKAKDEAILSSIGDGLIVTDPDRTVVFVNIAAEMLLSKKQKELIGEKWPIPSLITNENNKQADLNSVPIVRAIKEKETITLTSGLWYGRADGKRFPVAITASPILADDQVLGAIVVFRDITLEEEVDKAKTEFVSLASHQLRTPLSTVSWYAEMLLGGEVGDLTNDQQVYLKEVYDANQRMVDLVNALLNVSRLELGTFSVEPKEVNLDKTLDIVLKELGPQIKLKKQSIEKHIAKDLPEISADPNQIIIIFQNLLSNAVKYTSEAGLIEITVEERKKGEPINNHKLKEDSVVITVKDTGYGIPEKQKGQIFSKLFRADNVKEKDTNGTGLGLYIVKSILEKSGGWIGFTSREDEGTTFFVTLPLKGMKAKSGTRRLNTTRKFDIGR